MKWKWIYIAVGGTFLIEVIERSRTNTFVAEAMKRRAEMQKPILLISSTPRPDFDLVLNPTDTVTWQLPYPNKSFAAVVSDATEEIPYPNEAIAEWTRIADHVYVNTHSMFSPLAWLDFSHKQIFVGKTTVPINPPINWAIGGGVAYYFWRKGRRKKKKEISPGTERKALPPPSEEVEEESTMDGSMETEEVKVESAPPINPDDLPQTDGLPQLPPPADELDGFDLMDGINLGIGSDDAFSEEMAKKGVTNLIFNPATMPKEHNMGILTQIESNPADSATIVDVLHQIDDKVERTGAIQVAYENIKPGGKIVIKEPQARKYLPEVKELFPNAKLRKGVIHATKT